MTPRSRHIPLRSCIICGNKTSKRELMRIVVTPEAQVATDPTGRMSGRGAYVCRDGSCVQTGLKRGRLEHALHTKLEDDDWVRILSAVETLTTPR